jgi:hypothetical protein
VLEPEIVRAKEQAMLDRSWLVLAAEDREKAHAALRHECDALLAGESEKPIHSDSL